MPWLRYLWSRIRERAAWLGHEQLLCVTHLQIFVEQGTNLARTIFKLPHKHVVDSEWWLSHENKTRLWNVFILNCGLLSMAYHFLHVLDKVIEVLMKYYGPSIFVFAFVIYLFLPNLNQLIKWLLGLFFLVGWTSRQLRATRLPKRNPQRPPRRKQQQHCMIRESWRLSIENYWNFGRFVFMTQKKERKRQICIFEWSRIKVPRIN